MSRYFLDTGPLTGLLLGCTWTDLFLRRLVENDDALTSVLVFGEIVERIRGMEDAAALEESLHDLAGNVIPLPVTIGETTRYVEIRRNLRPPYGPGLIGDIDTLVAATALEHDLIVVTLDSDFRRVPGLRYVLLETRTFLLIEQSEL